MTYRQQSFAAEFVCRKKKRKLNTCQRRTETILFLLMKSVMPYVNVILKFQGSFEEITFNTWRAEDK